MNPPVPSLKEILPKEKLRQQLHISGINMMGDCGQRFMFRYVLGIRRPPSAFLLVGKSCDESVTQDLEHKIETGELLKREDVLGIASAKFDAEQEAEPVELDREEKKEGKSLETVLGEAKDKTVALAGLHHDEAAPKIQAVRTRRKFSIDMDPFLRTRAKEMHAAAAETTDKYAAKMLDEQARSLNSYARDGVDFVGEQDIVERTTTYDDVERLVIRDTKTSAKSPSASLLDGSDKPGTADDSEQLTAYAVASHVIDGKLPDRMVLDYLVRTSAQKPGLYYVPTVTKRTMEDVTVFLNRFANTIHALKTGVFTPANPMWWGCSERWCGYADICPYIKRPKLVQITRETQHG
jgi:hypothetical protein